MKFIAHRGNTRGRNLDMENTVGYINAALALGFDVEIDIRYINGKFYLGHDEPMEKVSIEFFLNSRIWVHAKTIKTLHKLLHYSSVICFFHQRDRCTLTSNGYVWTFPYKGTSYGEDSIVVLPESLGGGLMDFTRIAGICSDYIEAYKEQMLEGEYYEQC